MNLEHRLRDVQSDRDYLNIKSWAIRRGWRPDDAGDLAALARKIWALKAKPSLSAIFTDEELAEMRVAWSPHAHARGALS